MRELQTLLESMIDDPEMTIEKATAKAKTGLALLSKYDEELSKNSRYDKLATLHDHLAMVSAKSEK